jgi:hypothetical protein
VYILLFWIIISISGLSRMLVFLTLYISLSILTSSHFCRFCSSEVDATCQCLTALSCILPAFYIISMYSYVMLCFHRNTQYVRLVSSIFVLISVQLKRSSVCVRA